MKAPTPVVDWTSIREEYVRLEFRPSLKAFAEQHDIGYDALRRRARREGWERGRAVCACRARVKKAEAELEFARAVATEAGRYVGKLCRATHVPLEALARDIKEAAQGISNVHSAAALLADFRRELEDAEAGRAIDYSRGPALDGLWDPRWNRPTRWPRPEEAPRLRLVGGASLRPRVLALVGGAA